MATSGYLAEGFANIPLGESAAIRLVGWVRHDGGYIDNVAGHAHVPDLGHLAWIRWREDNYNDADTYGARAALKIDLNDNWSITPSVMFQKQKGNGIYAGEQSTIGDLEVAHWHPENSDDQWAQAALTVEGKMSNFDITFASSYLKRDVDVNSDYSDYSFFYDTMRRLRHVLLPTTPASSSIRRSTSTARTATPRPATSCASRRRRRTAGVSSAACSRSARRTTSSRPTGSPVWLTTAM